MSKYSYLIGRNITWESHVDSNRGTYTHHEGKVLDVKGKNCYIDEKGEHDWQWIPFMKNIQIKE